MKPTDTRHRILVSCAKGIPPFLSEELRALGYAPFDAGRAALETDGTLTDAMRLNLHLRTGQRVLFELMEFRAINADQLYRHVVRFPWEDYIPADGYVSVNSSVQMPDARIAPLRCKDAIVDRIRQQMQRRPDSGPDRNRTVVFLFWQDRICRVYLDTSGESIAKRGYRKIPGEAPMQETLAAAVILATGWKGDTPFVNPMCGSGTLAIEAALIGLHRAPGLQRENFGFMHLRDYDAAAWNNLRDEARRAAKQSLPHRMVVSDIRADAVRNARQNARAAGVDHLMDFHVCDFADTPVPAGPGTVVLNPEYGERLGSTVDLEPTYRRIGDFFKKKCTGYMGYVFTGNLDLAKKVGLRSKRKVHFFNSEIECRLLGFELYAGSVRKAKQVDLPVTDA